MDWIGLDDDNIWGYFDFFILFGDLFERRGNEWEEGGVKWVNFYILVVCFDDFGVNL